MRELIKKILHENLKDFDNNILKDYCISKIKDVNKIFNLVNGFELSDDDKNVYINKLNKINYDFDEYESKLTKLSNFDEITYVANDYNSLLYEKIQNLLGYLEGDNELKKGLFRDVNIDINY